MIIVTFWITFYFLSLGFSTLYDFLNNLLQLCTIYGFPKFFILSSDWSFISFITRVTSFKWIIINRKNRRGVTIPSKAAFNFVETSEKMFKCSIANPWQQCCLVGLMLIYCRQQNNNNDYWAWTCKSNKSISIASVFLWILQNVSRTFVL